MRLHPNPAGSFTILDHDTPYTAQHQRLVLRDIHGRLMRDMPITGQQGQEVITLADLVTGVYTVEFIVDGERVATERVVVKP